jgi:L-seryl-tRNA(Ser) seleniumtransferase
MLALSLEEMEKRARRFLSRLRRQLKHESLRFEIIEGESAIGGGAAPTTHLRTALIALHHNSLSPDALDQALRRSAPPIIARIVEDNVLLDLRTVAGEEEDELLRVLVALTA